VNIFINMGACALGAGLGYWVRPRDFWANFWGIGAMISIAFALTIGGPWYLLGVPVFGLLLATRRQKSS